VKSTWFSDPNHYQYAKLLAEANYGANSYTTFHDWLEVVCISLEQSVRLFVNGEICPEAEKRYLTIMKNYQNADNFPKALAVMVNSLEDRPHDFLGCVFQALGLNDGHWKGQVFTPYHISELLAAMTMQELVSDTYSPYSPLQLDEPACGAGSMVIAGTQVLRKNRFRNNQFVWQASDIDIHCVQMTYLQASLMDIPCIIHHRNTLTRETWRTYVTFAAARELPLAMLSIQKSLTAYL
jgi:type I restriction-modification system DNA methylase subunit